MPKKKLNHISVQKINVFSTQVNDDCDLQSLKSMGKCLGKKDKQPWNSQADSDFKNLCYWCLYDKCEYFPPEIKIYILKKENSHKIWYY